MTDWTSNRIKEPKPKPPPEELTATIAGLECRVEIRQSGYTSASIRGKLEDIQVWASDLFVPNKQAGIDWCEKSAPILVAHGWVHHKAPKP